MLKLHTAKLLNGSHAYFLLKIIVFSGNMTEYADMAVSASLKLYGEKLNQQARDFDEKADNISELFRNFNESLMIEGEVFSNK